MRPLQQTPEQGPVTETQGGCLEQSDFVVLDNLHAHCKDLEVPYP